MPSKKNSIKFFLDQKSLWYEQPRFIGDDPICVPHRFTRKQDIEIAGFFAATLAWGNRTTIIRSANRIMELMDNAPYEFIRNHTDDDLKPFTRFVHRTFNATDLLYFIAFLQHHYSRSTSLEDAFVPDKAYQHPDTGAALSHFHQYFFSIEHPERTRKHVATPDRNSACKRLNMYLRWMVRSEVAGVDFGIWKKISPRQLVCPLDVHVARVATRLGLIATPKADWNNAIALTSALRKMDKDDPARYDFALFGLGAEERL